VRVRVRVRDFGFGFGFRFGFGFGFGSCTRIREAQRQICPALRKEARTAASTARSMSQSAKTSMAFLPPSSSESFAKRGATAAATAAPACEPPVKETAPTLWWEHSAAPASWPVPCTTLKMPRGRPARSRSPASIVALVGVSSEGLATIALPMASAGASFHVSR
jgi:hypothetical protein